MLKRPSKSWRNLLQLLQVRMLMNECPGKGKNGLCTAAAEPGGGYRWTFWWLGLAVGLWRVMWGQ